SAVFGTHTHVPTADDQSLGGGTAYMTDLGMCGGHRGVIGRESAPVLKVMRTQEPAPFEVATGERRACGCLLTIDFAARRAVAIEPLAIDAPG
ncbi:MAG TPA: metallophosphoesterase, partial [Phycisphaerales bacterium]|nr:metallophosphoesterase [Phycisphaerales bacterium]